jgi:hypothetical protein
MAALNSGGLRQESYERMAANLVPPGTLLALLRGLRLLHAVYSARLELSVVHLLSTDGVVLGRP